MKKKLFKLINKYGWSLEYSGKSKNLYVFPSISCTQLLNRDQMREKINDLVEELGSNPCFKQLIFN